MAARRVFVLLALCMALTPSAATSFQRLQSFRGHGFRVVDDQGDDDSTLKISTPAVKGEVFDGAVLDHFAPLTERQHWRQRYFVNDEFWGGHEYPVFLYIGGEGPLGPRALTNHSYIHLAAQRHRALLLALEHRFYGTSYPTTDMSLSNLRFLSSEQALADLAHFHAFISKSFGLPRSSKWVAFGGSYPGNLAAWVKLKYPALFVGTIASSAPVHAKVDFHEYLEVVGDGLRFFGGGECYRAVEQAITALRELLDGGKDGRAKVIELFSPCDPMVDELDDSVFETSVMGAFQDIAQYNELHDGLLSLSQVCDRFTNSSSSASPIQRLASFLAETRGGPCLDSKFEGSPNGTVEVLSNATFDGKNSARQWIYQTCNEFGYFQTATSSQSPFHALSAVTVRNVGAEICKRVYNTTAPPDVDGTNVDYGSLGITVENVTFPSGTIDPWHALAVRNATRLRSTTAKSVFIEGTAHCADMYYPKAGDSAAMQWAHRRIEHEIDRYLGYQSVDSREKNPVGGGVRDQIVDVAAVE